MSERETHLPLNLCTDGRTTARLKAIAQVPPSLLEILQYFREAYSFLSGVRAPRERLSYKVRMGGRKEDNSVVLYIYIYWGDNGSSH
jgi:hypothetical protein